MDEFKSLPVTFETKLLKDLLHVNLAAAYHVAKQPGVSVRIGRRLVILRDGLIKWLETEAQKDKAV